MGDIVSCLKEYRVSADPEHPVHPAICDEAAAEIELLRMLNKEMKKVDAPRATLELLVRLGYEMECLSTSRCAELLNEDIVTFRERGWVQARIKDAMVLAAIDSKEYGNTYNIMQILKDFD